MLQLLVESSVVLLGTLTCQAGQLLLSGFEHLQAKGTAEVEFSIYQVIATQGQEVVDDVAGVDKFAPQLPDEESARF